MTTLHWLLHTYPFLIALFVGLSCEVVKILVEGFRTGNWRAGFLRSGGMPSSHSAFVTSLLIIVWYKLGLESVEFAMAFVFAALVWYDSASSRHAIDEHAKVLNKLQHWQKLSQRIGHSPTQVIVGIAYGAVVTAVGIYLS